MPKVPRLIRRAVVLLGPVIQHRLDMEEKYGRDWPDKPVYNLYMIICPFVNSTMAERSHNLALGRGRARQINQGSYHQNPRSQYGCDSHNVHGKLHYIILELFFAQETEKISHFRPSHGRYMSSRRIPKFQNLSVRR